jgi:hypothetical protein
MVIHVTPKSSSKKTDETGDLTITIISDGQTGDDI